MGEGVKEENVFKFYHLIAHGNQVNTARNIYPTKLLTEIKKNALENTPY